MKSFFTALILIIPTLLQAQEAIGKKFSDVKTKIIRSEAKLADSTNKLKVTDSTLSFQKNISGIQSEMSYRFNKEGFCIIEKFATASEKEYQKKLKTTLRKKKYGWRSLNLNQFISKLKKNILLEVQVIDGIYSISFIKTNLDKELYNLLLIKKK